MRSPELDPVLVDALIEASAARAGFSPTSVSAEAVARTARRFLDEGALDGAALLAAVREGRADVVDAFHGAVAAGETYFFRHPEHFESIVHDWLPARIRDGARAVRAWSAGCATGEEAYSLAAALSAVRDDVVVDVIGTDLVPSRIAAAEAARYGPWSLRSAGPLLHPVTRALDDGRFTVVDAVRARVRFFVHNLLDPAPGTFDLILCRNVFVYLDARAAARAAAHLVDALRPGGAICFGPLDVSGDVPGVVPRGPREHNMFVKPLHGVGATSARRAGGAGDGDASGRAVAIAADGTDGGATATDTSATSATAATSAISATSAAAAATAPTAEVRDPVELHVSALELIERGQQRSAEVLLEDLCRRQPGYLPALLECALLYERRGRATLAESLMFELSTRASRLPPDAVVRGPEDLPATYYAASARAFFSARGGGAPA